MDLLKHVERISAEEAALLHLLVGRRVGWIFGFDFIVEGDLVVSERFAFPIDGALRYVVVESERLETAMDYLDYARFRLTLVSSEFSNGRPCGPGPSFPSRFVIPEAVEVTSVGIAESSFVGDANEVAYDSFVYVGLSDGRTLSVGHAPRVYDGVCLTLGQGQSLANPTVIRVRYV